MRTACACGQTAPMEQLIWPPWIEVAAGMAGLAWCISIFAKPPKTRGDLVNRWGFLIFSALLTAVGAIMWLGL